MRRDEVAGDLGLEPRRDERGGAGDEAVEHDDRTGGCGPERDPGEQRDLEAADGREHAERRRPDPVGCGRACARRPRPCARLRPRRARCPAPHIAAGSRPRSAHAERGRRGRVPDAHVAERDDVRARCRRARARAPPRARSPRPPAPASSPAPRRRWPFPARDGGRGSAGCAKRLDTPASTTYELRPGPRARTQIAAPPDAKLREHLPRHLLRVRAHALPRRRRDRAAATTIAARSGSGATVPRIPASGHAASSSSRPRLPRGFVLRSSSARAPRRASSSTGGTTSRSRRARAGARGRRRRSAASAEASTQTRLTEPRRSRYDARRARSRARSRARPRSRSRPSARPRAAATAAALAAASSTRSGSPSRSSAFAAQSVRQSTTTVSLGSIRVRAPPRARRAPPRSSSPPAAPRDGAAMRSAISVVARLARRDERHRRTRRGSPARRARRDFPLRAPPRRTVSATLSSRSARDGTTAIRPSTLDDLDRWRRSAVAIRRLRQHVAPARRRRPRARRRAAPCGRRTARRASGRASRRRA